MGEAMCEKTLPSVDVQPIIICFLSARWSSLPNPGTMVVVGPQGARDSGFVIVAFVCAWSKCSIDAYAVGSSRLARHEYSTQVTGP